MPQAIAGSSIGPAIEVNDGIVTSYELDQRIKLMTLLHQPGDIPSQARQSLIDDRLRHAAAVALGVSIPDSQVQQGMAAFAARGQLSLEQMTQLLNQNGIDLAALRDFVRAGLEWRAAVQAKFSGQVNISDAEIDRAISAGVAAGGALQVLLSEVFLPTAAPAPSPGAEAGSGTGLNMGVTADTGLSTGVVAGSETGSQTDGGTGLSTGIVAGAGTGAAPGTGTVLGTGTVTGSATVSGAGTGADTRDAALLARRIREGSTTLAAFQVYAQKYSKAPNAAAGGQLGWQPLSALPPAVAAAVAKLKPGEMTQPLAVNGGIAIYYLRDESENAGQGRPVFDVDYAILTLADAATAQAVAASATRCEDLYPLARSLPEEALARQTRRESSLPRDLAALFGHMDPGETTTRPVTGGTQVIMLCNRVPESKIPPSRAAVRTALSNRKLALVAEAWLQQMRADAIIRVH